MQFPKFLTSSDGTGKLSGRINSILLGALPAVVLIAPFFGFQILNPEEGVKSVVALVAAVELAISAFWHIKSWSDRNFRRENNLGSFAE